MGMGLSLRRETGIRHMTTFQPETIRTLISTYITQELAYDQPGLVLTDDFELVGQGMIDSMDLLRLITFIEQKFNINLTPEDMQFENFATLHAITAFVLQRTIA